MKCSECGHETVWTCVYCCKEYDLEDGRSPIYCSKDCEERARLWDE